MTSPTTETVPQVSGAARRNVVFATLIGNFMEWFDFAVYGFVASIIGAVFFPSNDPTTELLSSLAVFGIAFFFRPFGGAIFGFIGDRVGRRTALAIAIIVMGVATACIGLLPGYAQIGIWAPILLVVIRSIQGMSVGGEWTGASTFLVEYSPSNKRGRWSSLISITAALGMIGGSGTVYLLSINLSEADMMSWGWRLPFLAAVPLTLIGLYMRLKLEDTPVFKAMQETEKAPANPFKHIGKRGIRNILIAFAFSAITGTGFYYFATYFNNYLSTTVGFPRPQAVLLSLLSLAIYAVLCFFAGYFSDRFGRKVTYVLGAFGHAVLVLPVFFMLNTGVFGIALLGLAIYAVSQAMINTMSSVTIVEFFPPKIRATAGAIGYNLGVGPVAGTGPLVAAALVAATGNPFAPAYYLIALAVIIGIVMVIFLPETSKRSLHIDYDTESAPDEKPAPAETDAR
ncbi:MFS transporter [Gulosibacter sp. 10]|uniref:MFS transporter n=1 Tax=Gulosibacter sp. 10 TaxID=1255570 RepID=UPI00097EC815|nr:MFS transporter [Gulosibacter sp. 10]SJM51160.1 L-Proline/Glycine betaine transporter ProP [Gulosibacter sp. 10]